MTPVRIGVSSWSDSSLTQDGGWYPRKTMRAAERMDFYAQHFPIVEMESAYRFPPTAAVAEQWVERTPDDFLFDIPAWSLLTGQPTFPPSLWEDLAQEVRTDRRDRPRLYPTHLSAEALDECWSRFRHALGPLVDAGKLGAVLLRYPRWFSPRATSREVLQQTREQLGDLPACIEFECADWVDSESCEETFALLEDLDFGFVCVDAADDNPRSLKGTAATTNDVAVVRLLGRRPVADENEWRVDRRGYRYTDHELQEVAATLHHLAAGAKEVHALFSTCWRDDAVRNAEALQRLIVSPDRRLRSVG